VTRTFTQPVAAFFAVVLVAITAVIALQSPAGAHAEMLTSDPPNGQTLSSPPQKIIVRFSEAVSATKEAFHIYSSTGSEIEVGEAFHPNGDPNALAVEPKSPSELADGSFIAMYRIISADSHAIHGAVNFQVGSAAAAADAGMVQTLLDGDRADTEVSVLQGTLRGLVLLTTVLALGAIAMMYALRDTHVARRFARWSLATLLAGTVLGVFSQGIYTNTMSIGHLFDADLARSTLDTDYGSGALVRFGAAVLALVALQTRRFEVLLGVYAMIIAASFGIAGHASTGRLPVAGVLLDLAHIAAGSAWFGGLAIVFVMAARKHPDIQHTLQRFSRIALICAAVILITGMLQTWRQLHTWDALTQTDHGRLIIAKTALFFVIVITAYFSRRAVRSHNTSVRRHMGVEIVFALAVVVVTTVLTGTSPGNAPTPSNYERTSGIGDLRVTLHVEPTRVGVQSVTVDIRDANGAPVDVPEVAMSLTLANEGLGPFAVMLDRASAGRYTSSTATVPRAGTWTARVVVRSTDIDQSSTSFAVPVSNKENN
jgi:copper transport protein